MKDSGQEADKLIARVARVLSLTGEEACKLIQSAIESPDPQDMLIDVLGYEHIELVFDVVKNAAQFAASETETEETAYIEHVLPENRRLIADEATLVPTSALDAGDRRFFAYQRFNAVQSRVFEAAYRNSANLLVAAPTGAGKTDIALLTILRALKEPGGKVAYVVPMKALATEITSKYSKIFAGSFSVVEYTGDTEVESSTASRADVIICTPEKLDVATRRLSPVLTGMRLVVIDEIHLLGDDRGPVLECLVARMFRRSELEQRIVRIVGLSATLPNYRDVARFIRADSVFFFNQMYRPVPLRITVTGFKKSSRKADESRYLLEKIRHFRTKKQQVLVFVHSRAGTVTVAKMISEEEGLVSGIGRMEVGASERPVANEKGCKKGKKKNSKSAADEKNTISDNGKNMKSSDRAEKYKKHRFSGIAAFLVQNRIGIHHAGLSRADRLEMEGLFKNGELDILVCTATLAWGVNLPAHAVIINGTSFYNPVKGNFDDVGILDVIQIFGRAGRPQYDTEGEAILITRSDKMDSYLALLKCSKDIESRMLYHVTDAIGAEVYLNTIQSVATALRWIRNTFLYIRMQANPAMYGIAGEREAFGSFDAKKKLGGSGAVDGRADTDNAGTGIKYGMHDGAGRSNAARLHLDENALSDYILLSIKRLESCGLIKISKADKYNHNTWLFESTAFGRIASTYYLSHLTMHHWLFNINACRSEEAVVEVLLGSEELKSISLREEEIPVLNDMFNQLLIARAVDSEFEASVECKLVVLLQAHFNYMRPPLFSLCCDMDYIAFWMERMVAALGEVYLHLKVYEMYRTTLLLEQKVKRSRMRKEMAFTATALRVGAFIDLSVVLSDNDHRKKVENSARRAHASAFIYSDKKIVYACEFIREFHGYVKCMGANIRIEVHGADAWDARALPVTYSYSMAGLYHYGIHTCDSIYTLGSLQEDCVHFKSHNAMCKKAPVALAKTLDRETYGNLLSVKFDLRITFITVGIPNFRERLRAMDNKIYRLEGPLLVVCPAGCHRTADYLNTQLALEGRYMDMFESHGGPSTRLVTGLDHARRIADKFDTIVFKGCFDGRKYYPIYEIFSICDGKKALIYENTEFIEYLKGLL